MEVLTAALLIGVISLIVLAFLGYGVTRLLLPTALSDEAVLWTPFVGYTLASIVYHALNVQFLSGLQSTQILLLLGTIITALSLIFGRALARPPTRVLVCLCAAGVVTFVIGVAPLVAIGQLTAIAKNYDLIDIYDATAAYIRDFPVNSILTSAPPNPLARLIAGPITLSNGWGLSYLHALASIVTDRSPIETQAPVFSLTHALLIPATYVFARRALHLTPWIAVVASVGLGLHGMLLSIVLIGLGNHTAILALLPLIFTSTFLALDDRRPGTVLFAGLMLTNIPLTYWAAFPFYIPPVLVYTLIGPHSPLRRLRPVAGVGPHRSAARSVNGPLVSGKFRRWEFVPLARALAGLGKTARMRINAPSCQGEIIFIGGKIYSASLGGARGLAGLERAVGVDDVEFVFEEGQLAGRR